MPSGCDAYMEEIPVRGEPEADRMRLPARQYINQVYVTQDPPKRAGVAKAGRKKRQETDDEMSELESSDNRKTNSDVTRQRGRPRLDTRDESQAEVSYLIWILLFYNFSNFFVPSADELRFV